MDEATRIAMQQESAGQAQDLRDQTVRRQAVQAKQANKERARQQLPARGAAILNHLRQAGYPNSQVVDVMVTTENWRGKKRFEYIGQAAWMFTEFSDRSEFGFNQQIKLYLLSDGQFAKDVRVSSPPHPARDICKIITLDTFMFVGQLADGLGVFETQLGI